MIIEEKPFILCPECQQQYVQEEFLDHNCLAGKPVISAIAMFGKYYVSYDKIKWYRYFPNHPNPNTRKRHPQDGKKIYIFCSAVRSC